MEYTDYTAVSERCSIAVPLFLGDDTAMRMNHFYARALDVLWEYGTGLTASSRRSSFFCRSSVEETEGVFYVTLQMTFRYPGEVSRRKNVSHQWKDGYLVRKRRPDRRKKR